MANHPLLSAPVSERWTVCAALSQSEYAEMGRLAHSICELKELEQEPLYTEKIVREE